MENYSQYYYLDNNSDNTNYDDLKLKDDRFDDFNDDKIKNSKDDDIDDIEISYFNFVHFKTTDECSEFIRYINIFGIKIENKCCNGIGCSVKISELELHKLKEEFEKSYINHKNCDICYESKILFTKCYHCKNPVCNDCHNKLIQKICPFCRKKI
jgi:hypothetical protein